MPAILIDLLCVVASGLLGATAASWLWYSHVRRRTKVTSQPEKPSATEATARLQKLATQMAFDFAVRLNDLVAQVAFDVGEHNSQVQEINDELTSSKSHDATKVLDVVVRLVEANQHMQNKLTATEEKLREQTDRMQTLLAETRTDSLTLLANRRAFDEELAKRLAELRRQGRTFALTVLDVDRFKNFNDTYGHRAGDELLQGVAKVLRRKMRETDLVARYGGDEFAIIHPGASLADACKSAQRACEAIEKHQFGQDGKHFRVTASLGVAEVVSGEGASELLKRADSAMYASKESGRNCVHVHDGTIIRRLRGNKEPVLSSPEPQQPSQLAPSGHHEADQASAAQPAKAESPAEDVALRETPFDLCGRTHFCQQVRNRMAEWKRGGSGFSIALIEVGQSDENGGHIDQRTRELASRLTAKFLVATIREMDVLGSYTPHCFALMMPTAGLGDAIRVADRLLSALGQHIAVAPRVQPAFMLSVGVVQVIDADDVTSVLKRAEIALEAADCRGSNRVYFHDGDRVSPASAIVEMETTGYLT